jgi:hypothetical protein
MDQPFEKELEQFLADAPIEEVDLTGAYEISPGYGETYEVHITEVGVE